ncbi:MAG: YfhO family protein [Bacteroidales bacterium]|nr:YfhO family protein [Bacteroidales bacterium]
MDGKLTPHFRANYVLRAMMVPAGEHKIEFRFEPQNYKTGEKISLASSILLVLLLLSAFGLEVYKLIKKEKESV